MTQGLRFLQADWPAPVRVRTAVSLRQGGISDAPYDSLNLGGHVGDDPAAVAENRRRLRETLQLPAEPCWLSQVHGTAVLSLDETSRAAGAEADACWTARRGAVCAILTADCLPVLFCSRDGTVVAAAHAGWRGLAAGVLEATIKALPVAPQNLLAWLGPAIGPSAFEVGPEVLTAFSEQDAGIAACFVTGTGGKFKADLYALARRRLHQAGVPAIYGGGRCTYTEAQDLYSFRRSGRCGRMASLIWLS